MVHIRNGHDHATWIPLNIRTTLDEHWASIDFQNKSTIAKANRAIDKGASAYCCGASMGTMCLGGGGENKKFKLKYQQRREELQQSVTEERTFANDSSFASINDNDIYYEVVGGKNEKGNIYELGILTNKLMRSSHILTNLIEMSIVQQIEKMHR
ncbi:hypothetical protein CR513_24918, partial [Mucuna pruriens]